MKSNQHPPFFTAIIQVNATLMILLVQSFTARMPLLTAISVFGLWKRCWSSPQQCYLHCLYTLEPPI